MPLTLIHSSIFAETSGATSSTSSTSPTLLSPYSYSSFYSPLPPQPITTITTTTTSSTPSLLMSQQESKYSLHEQLFHSIQVQQQNQQHQQILHDLQETQHHHHHLANNNNTSVTGLDSREEDGRLSSHLFSLQSVSSASSSFHSVGQTSGLSQLHPHGIHVLTASISPPVSSSHSHPLLGIPSQSIHDPLPLHHHHQIHHQQQQRQQHLVQDIPSSRTKISSPNTLPTPSALSSLINFSNIVVGSASIPSPSVSYSGSSPEERKYFGGQNTNNSSQPQPQQQQHHQLSHEDQSILSRGRSSSSSSTSTPTVICSATTSNNTSMTNCLGSKDEDSEGDDNRPHLKIIEQPTNRIRYRYKSEKGSHGGLTGENNTQAKKTYPMVRLDNYNCLSDRIMIQASLVTHDDHHEGGNPRAIPRKHVHKLMGRNCTEEGVCVVPLGQNNTAVFQNLGILFVGKKEVPDILYKRKLQKVQCQLERLLEVERMVTSSTRTTLISEVEKDRMKGEAEREAKDLNLNCVRLCFEAFDFTYGVNNIPICPPVFSRSIANQKSPDSGELRIVRIDRQTGRVEGDDEVFILCEKVNKKEIKVRFFELDEEGNQVWESFGSFSESDVHHQVAIVFRTPPYHDNMISHPVTTFVQLYRRKDGEYSEAKPFVFLPRGVLPSSLGLDTSLMPRTSSDASFNRSIVDRSRKRFSSMTSNNSQGMQSPSVSAVNPSNHPSDSNENQEVVNSDFDANHTDKESFISFD